MPGVIMAYSPESHGKKLDDMNNRKTIRPYTTQSKGRLQTQSGLKNSQQRVKTASYTNQQFNSTAKMNLLSQLEQSQSQIIKQSYHSNNMQRQKNQSMSHVIRQNLQEERHREQELILQEQMYAQKLANIRRIMKTTNPFREQDPTINELQSEIIRYQHQQMAAQTQVQTQSYQAVQDPRNQQLQRLEKLKKLQQQKTGMSESDIMENGDHQDMINYNIVNLQQGVDTITPNVNELYSEMGLDMMDQKKISLTQKQTLEQYKNLNNLQNSREKRAQRNLKQKNNLTKKSGKKGKKKSSEGRSSVPSPNQQMEQFIQMGSSPINMQRFDILSGSHQLQKSYDQLSPVKKKSKSPKLTRDPRNRVRTAQQKGAESSNLKKRDHDYLAIGKTQESVTVRRIQSQNQIGSKSKRNKSTNSRAALSGQSRQSRSNSLKRSVKSKSAKSRKRSSQKSSNKSRSKSKSKKSRKKSSQELRSQQFEVKSIDRDTKFKEEDNLIKITSAYDKDSQGSVNSKKGSSNKFGAAKKEAVVQKQESLNQNSQVSYLANNQLTESCDSINIQLKQKNLQKKRGKVSSAIVRRKQDPSFVNKQSSIGVSFPTNEKLINSIGSMQDQIQEIENNIKIEESNLKSQQKSSKKEMHDIIQRSASNQSGLKKQDPLVKKTLDTLESHIENQFLKNNNRRKSRKGSNVDSSKNSQSPLGSKRRDSQKSSKANRRSFQKKAPTSPSQAASGKERTFSDKQSRKVDENKEQESFAAAELEEGTIKIFDEKADTIEKGQQQISNANMVNIQRMNSMPIANLLEDSPQQPNNSQGLTSKLKKVQRPVPKEKFPELRTVWKDFDEGMLLEYINKAKEYKERYYDSPQQFGNSKDAANLISQDMLSTVLEQEEMRLEAQEDRSTIISDLCKVMKREIKDSIKYRMDDAFKPIHLRQKGQYNDQTYQEFTDAYKSKNLKNFVFTENFKEQTKQWKLAYDPYSADKMLTIYGKTPPMSFKIRQRVFDDQRNILDRYSLPAPVHNRNSVYDEIQRQYNMSRRDYMAEKQYQRYLQEEKDQQYIWDDIANSQDLYLETLELPNDEHLLEQDLEKAYLDFVGDKTRKEVQPLIEERLNALQKQMSDLQLLESSTLVQSCDQSDFQSRFDFNQSFDTAHDFDKERVDNDQIYKTKFCYKLLSMINERWNPSMESEDFYTTLIMKRLMDKLHNNIFESLYFNFDSNVDRMYCPYSSRMEEQSREVISVNQMFSFTTQSSSPHVVVLKDQELSLRKEFYYPEHYEYNHLLKFIYSPSLISIQTKVLLGCKEKVMKSINFFVQFHAQRPQYKNQQYMQKHENKDDIIQGAQKLFLFLKNDFDKSDQDVIVDQQIDPSRPHPYSVEFFYNRAAFRSIHVPGKREDQPQFEVLEGQLAGMYRDKPLLHEAFNTAILQRLQKQFQQIQELYKHRKNIVDNKMKKYQLKLLRAKSDYQKSEMIKLKRQNSFDAVEMRKESYEYLNKSELVNDLWRAKASQILPFTEEALYPQRALPPQGKMAKANFRQIQFQTPFEAPMKPYIEKWPIEHLKGLIDQYETFFKENAQKVPQMVAEFQDHQVEETLFKQWIENTYCEKIEEQVPLSMSERIKTIHFQHPGFVNKVIDEQIDQAKTQQQTLFDSSDTDSEDLEPLGGPDGTTTDPLSDLDAQQNTNLNTYFQSRLRKELKQSILQKDLATFKNYVTSLDGSLSEIVNHKDKRHQGNTLLHLAVLELDKNGNNNKKVELMNIISMLVSNQMGAKKDIENELGCTAIDYAKRVRNTKDQTLLLGILDRI